MPFSSHAQALGVNGAAKRILRDSNDGWSRDAEEFFRKHWCDLETRMVVAWMGFAVPEGMEARRYTDLVPVVFGCLKDLAAKHPDHAYQILSDTIAQIADEHARDELVDRTRSLLDPNVWQDLFPLAVGWAEFHRLATELNSHRAPD